MASPCDRGVVLASSVLMDASAAISMSVDSGNIVGISSHTAPPLQTPPRKPPPPPPPSPPLPRIPTLPHFLLLPLLMATSQFWWLRLSFDIPFVIFLRVRCTTCLSYCTRHSCHSDKYLDSVSQCHIVMLSHTHWISYNYGKLPDYILLHLGPSAVNIKGSRNMHWNSKF